MPPHMHASHARDAIAHTPYPTTCNVARRSHGDSHHHISCGRRGHASDACLASTKGYPHPHHLHTSSLPRTPRPRVLGRGRWGAAAAGTGEGKAPARHPPPDKEGERRKRQTMRARKVGVLVSMSTPAQTHRITTQNNTTRSRPRQKTTGTRRHTAISRTVPPNPCRRPPPPVEYHTHVWNTTRGGTLQQSRTR